MTIQRLMSIEKALLEIDSRYKFDLPFNDAIKLNKLLGDVGSITNYFFEIQSEYAEKYGDYDKLKEYHEKLMEEEIEYNRDEAILFISKVYNLVEDNEFKEMVDNLGILR